MILCLWPGVHHADGVSIILFERHCLDNSEDTSLSLILRLPGLQVHSWYMGCNWSSALRCFSHIWPYNDFHLLMDWSYIQLLAATLYYAIKCRRFQLLSDRWGAISSQDSFAWKIYRHIMPNIFSRVLTQNTCSKIAKSRTNSERCQWSIKVKASQPDKHNIVTAVVCSLQLKSAMLH